VRSELAGNSKGRGRAEGNKARGGELVFALLPFLTLTSHLPPNQWMNTRFPFIIQNRLRTFIRSISTKPTLFHPPPPLPSSTMVAAKFPDPSNWPAAKVRATFIDFFEKTHGHTFWKSASVIPYEDRESLFAVDLQEEGETGERGKEEVVELRSSHSSREPPSSSFCPLVFLLGKHVYSPLSLFDGLQLLSSS